MQCKKCQSFGHTHNFCSKDPRCVKCAGMHDTKNCTKLKVDKVQCIHCGLDHPASYRGCLIAKELQKIKSQAEKPKKQKTYAEITADNNQNSAAKKEMSKQSESKEKDINQTLQLILRRLDNFDARIKNLETSLKGAVPKVKST